MKYLITLLTLLMSSTAFAYGLFERGSMSIDGNSASYTQIGVSYKNINLSGYKIDDKITLYSQKPSLATIGDVVEETEQLKHYGVQLGYDYKFFDTKYFNVSVLPTISYEKAKTTHISKTHIGYNIADPTYNTSSTETKDSYMVGGVSVRLYYNVMYIRLSYDTEQRVLASFGFDL